MRTIRLLFILILFTLLPAGFAHGQAVMEKDHTWHMYIGTDEFISYDAFQVYTPGGNINLRINFLIDPENPYIQWAREEGPITFDIVITTRGFKVPSTITFFPNGRVKVNGHL